MTFRKKPYKSTKSDIILAFEISFKLKNNILGKDKKIFVNYIYKTMKFYSVISSSREATASSSSSPSAEILML